MRTLHPHQADAIAMLRASLAAGKRRPMIQAPTGFGKTVVAGTIVRGALDKGKRPIIAVPAFSLIEQTVTSLWNEGITDVGVIQADHPRTDWSRPVQVASVQTLLRKPELPSADIVLIDEAHRWFDFLGIWMAMPEWAATPFVGLSATPWTRGLGKYFDDLIIAATTSELIEKGFLSPFRVYAPSHPDLSGVRTVAGDFHEGDLSKAMDKAPLIADVVDTWKRLADRRPTLCFAVDRAHAKNLQAKFQEAGVSAGYVDAYTTREERERIRTDFHRHSIDVVCNVGCLTTGVDWDVRCIVLARPTKSEMLFTQIIGRGLRTAEGKDDCLVLDHSDTHQRLGFVTDIHHTTLDDGKPRTKGERKERATPLPKECPKCTFLKPAKVHICPACGFKPERQSNVAMEDGHLVELGKKGAKPKVDTATKQRWWSMLLHIALKERGYKRGWAWNQYQKKFGVKPSTQFSDVTVYADQEVRRWVKHSQIAFAKARQKESHHGPMA